MTRMREEEVLCLCCSLVVVIFDFASTNAVIGKEDRFLALLLLVSWQHPASSNLELRASHAHQ